MTKLGQMCAHFSRASGTACRRGAALTCLKSTRQQPIRAVILDKDGTLVDFERTWQVGYRASAEAVASLPGCRADARTLLKICGMNVDTGRVIQDSPLSEATGPEIARMWSMCFEARPASFGRTKTEEGLGQMIQGIWSSTLSFTAEPLGDIDGVLRQLSAAGVKLAVVTNDIEKDARQQMQMMRVDDVIDCVIGYDSGYGAKPQPGGIVAACEILGVSPSEAIMVGDSPGDIAAGAAAGCAGRVSVNSLSRGDGRMTHEEVTHDIECVGQLPALLALEGGPTEVARTLLQAEAAVGNAKLRSSTVTQHSSPDEVFELIEKNCIQFDGPPIAKMKQFANHAAL